MRPCFVTRHRRVRTLCNESVSVAAVENARDFGALTLRLGDALEMRGVLEYLPNVRIGEAADHVLACQQGAEDLDLVAGDGIEIKAPITIRFTDLSIAPLPPSCLLSARSHGYLRRK